jgi:rubrerythrin
MEKCTKWRYSKRQAETVRNSRLRARHGRPDQLRIYHCPVCNHWHLTHTPR